ncbi:MAG TPA: ISAs1 family transposase, partial [Steroidobacteraceae bacterium]|nr:ISAs1 family transposase [Steroidobacteraceae bacterium]
VTIDAMGCQKEIASQIRQQKGHYVLALKGNQSGWEEELKQFYLDAADADFAGLKHEILETEECGHSRHEQRFCEVLEIPANHPQHSLWKDLCALVLLTCSRTVGDRETSEMRLYISSHKPKAKPLAAAIRIHWSIENTQHCVLPVRLCESFRRIC